MGATPVCQITAAGCVRPTFADCLSYVQSSYRAIYGQDLTMDPATQDGQFLALLANAIHDCNGETLAAYNAQSPSTAQGAGLARVVKINGIRPKGASYSTAPFLNVGQAGIAVPAGVITDPAGYQWSLPAFTIPDAGQITVTGTCQTLGAIALAAGAVDTAKGKGSIATITRGWQSATNTAAASVGQPVEKDSTLRQRQTISTALPSLSLADGLRGALAAISGVTRLKVYDNDTGTTDVNGIPGHCVAVVVDGGDAQTIGQIIRLKKGPGVSTYGTTAVTVTSTSGIPKPIRFFYLTQAPITYAITVQNLGGFTQSIQAQIQQALSDWTNGLDIGEDVERDQAFAQAKLLDALGSKTFKILSFQLARNSQPVGTADATIAFNEAAMCTPANVQISVMAS